LVSFRSMILSKLYCTGFLFLSISLPLRSVCFPFNLRIAGAIFFDGTRIRQIKRIYTDFFYDRKYKNTLKRNLSLSVKSVSHQRPQAALDLPFKIKKDKKTINSKKIQFPRRRKMRINQQLIKLSVTFQPVNNSISTDKTNNSKKI